jgi:serine phosphatase RsbU (regulator of sigma subunit)
VLPSPLTDDGRIRVEWCFAPSARLGGDAFTYFWIDDRHFAIALLDVCGHGVGPALHGMSAIHAVRTSTTDKTDPAAVLRFLNDAFQMDTHDGLFMTVWYGVYDAFIGQLRYASGGHPPAVLMAGRSAPLEAHELRKPSPIVGVARDSVYTVETVALDLRNELFVYSDGVFEITRPDGTMLRWAEFVDELRRPPGNGSKVRDVRSFCETVAGKEAFDDDFLLLHISIAPPVGGWPGRSRGWTAGAHLRRVAG